ncbi:TIMELESS-interacting protein-like isoform X1 [Mytilus californianus]|uniref:TIMELESS-interacting protein-like isoform X1 n=2 Tax=Mytilus californianus TaxID=6549 RepID=UPI0022486160|nr:TIMELESS-interacting protein-like isoform X1 [Mytilus californianus]
MESKSTLLRCLLKNKDMESVNLDMEDIFEEEAADDDFPSVGPLPDLPDGEEGAAEGEDEDNTDVMSKLKDLSKGAAKKVVRKPMPKLDGQRLTGERGIPILPKVFEKVKFKGQGNETQDLRIIMRYLEHWAHRLFPMMPFDEVLERIEKLGTKKEVQTCIKKMRLDMPLLNEDYIQDASDDEAGGSDKDKSPKKNGVNPVDETEWDDIIREHEEEQRLSQAPASQTATTPMSQLKSQLSKPLMDLKNTSQPYIATPISSPTASVGGLTPEQRERIERNKQLALQKKLGKPGFKAPAVPSSPFRTPLSSPVTQRYSPMMPPPVPSPCKSSPGKPSSSPVKISSSPCKSSPVKPLSSPCKLSPGSTPSSSNTVTFSSLVQNGNTEDSDLGVNKLSYNSSLDTQTCNTGIQNGEMINGGSKPVGDSEMSEVIPIIGKTVMNGRSSQAGDNELSEVIPNQDLKRNNDITDDNNLVKKHKLNVELTEDEILSSMEEN